MYSNSSNSGGNSKGNYFSNSTNDNNNQNNRNQFGNNKTGGKKSNKQNQSKNNRNNYVNNNNNNNNNNSNPMAKNQNYNNFNNDFNDQSNNYNRNYNNFIKNDKFELNNLGNNIHVRHKMQNNARNKRNSASSGIGYFKQNFFDENKTGEFITDRLNRSLNKEYNQDENVPYLTGIPTSYSLDSIAYCNLNCKTSPKMTNSFSFHTSPTNILNTYKNETATIHESDDPIENLKESQGESMSVYSTPMNQSGSENNQEKANADLISDNATLNLKKKSSENGVSYESSSSSPDSQNSQNQNDNETGESQMVTASEGELSFGEQPTIEKTMTNGIIETSFGYEVEQVAIKDININIESICINQYVKTNLTQKISEIEKVNEIEEENETTTSIENQTDSSLNESLNNLDEVDAMHLGESTEKKLEEEIIKKIEEKEEKEMSKDMLSSSSSQNTSSISTSSISSATKSSSSLNSNKNEKPASETHENINKNEVDHIKAPLAQKENLNEEVDQYTKFEEEEIHNLVNRIVLDVLAQATQAAQIINKINNSEKIKEEKEKNDSNASLEIIDSKLLNEAIKEDTKTELKEIDSKSISTESISKVLSKAGKIRQPEPAVDCFSCTIV